MRKLLAFLFVSSVFAACHTVPRSTAYNLDFEYTIQDTVPTQWGLPDAQHHGYRTSLDRIQRHHGISSLRMTQTDSTKSGWAIFWQGLPAELIAGREVGLSGWIQTQHIADGFADIYIAENEEIDYNILSLDTPDRGIRNTTDWTHISLKKQIGTHTSGAMIGGILKGDGTAWFDNLELTIDGVKLQDTVIFTPKTRLTRQDRAELRKYIHPLRTFEPDGGDTKDLKVLHHLIGHSRVVALGENTHGSSEVFKMKNRLLQYLAANEGFDIFSIEANMAESYRFNEYIKKGQSDARGVVMKQSFWIWKTQEMVDIVKWMRHFNRPEPQITYTGFDMQSYDASVALLKAAFENDKQTTSLLEEIDNNLKKALTYSSIGNPQVAPKIAEAATLELQQLKMRIEKSDFSDPQKAWLLQNATLLKQYLGQGQLGWRDRCMANNLLWINKKYPLSRIIIWAHNGHIQKCGGKMGHFLKDSLATDYTSFGFTFYDGSYTAIRRSSNQFIHKAQRAYPGTLEHLLEQVDEPIFILDLKKIRADNSPIIEWIDALNFRHVGVVKIEAEFPDRRITDAFDYLIFIRESTPSQLLYASKSVSNG